MTAFKKAKLRAGPETHSQCIAHIMSLAVKAIMRFITSKHENDHNDSSEEDNEIGREGIMTSGDSDADDGDNDNVSDDANNDEKKDEDENRRIDRCGGEPVLYGEDTAVDITSNLEDECLPDDKINPG